MCSLTTHVASHYPCWVCFRRRTMRMRGSRGGGVRGPEPSGKSQSCRVPKQYWSGSPGKSQSYQFSIQCWAIIGCKRNAIQIAFRWGRWWLTFSGIWILSPLIKKVVIVGPPDKTFWIIYWIRCHLHDVCWRADDGPLLMVFGSSLSHTQKKTPELDPLW